MTNQTPDALDLVWGCKAIGEVIGRTERITHDMCVRGQLPVRQVGQRWVAERKKLVAFFMEPAA